VDFERLKYKTLEKDLYESRQFITTRAMTAEEPVRDQTMTMT